HADVRAGYAKLCALKAGLGEDPELRSRVFCYTADWEATHQRVAGLEQFGALVLEQLWRELSAETLDRHRGQTWQDREREALAEFTEGRSRDFVGRESLIEKLLAHARSPMGRGDDGVCLTGPPGGGKSALFARLVVSLQQDREVLLLAHAAGISTRA